MKIGYFDCSAGISGDMILGALVDAGLSFTTLQRDLARLRLKGYRLRQRTVKRAGLRGCRVEVQLTESSKRYRYLPEIQTLIRSSRLPLPTQEQSLRTFKNLAAAEARVHGTTVSRIHFHELGAVDTLVDIVGSVIGLERLGLEKILFSPINTGQGTFKRPAGWLDGEGDLLPIPAPATAELLKGIPCFSTKTGMELATPTGVAIITTLGTPARTLPLVTLTAIGCGAGHLNPSTHPNILRLFIGELEETLDAGREHLTLLQTNIDDLNPQIYEYLMERLFRQGALDVYLTPIIMKKGRPATLLSVLTKTLQVSQLVKTIFHETTTLGIRIQEISRITLNRRQQTLRTPFGNLAGKVIFQDGKAVRIAPEYEACKRIAEETGLPLRDVLTHAIPVKPKTKRR
jgi:uncharacterized protein (TIGR00299 family) protein